MRIHLATLFALFVAAGCAVSSGVVVQGAGPDDLLKLREGPGLNYNIIIGLPDGTRLNRHNCMSNSGKLWCRVSLAEKPSVTGYVAADYLTRR